MAKMLQYIAEQPDVVRTVARAYGPGGSLAAQLREAVQILRSRPNVLLLGMGSSLFSSELIAQYGNVPSFPVDTSELIYYRRALLDADAAVLAISQSGESVETRKAVAMFAGRLPIVAITNNVESSIARESDAVLPMLAGEETGPACKTYVATQAVLSLLIAGLDGGVDHCVEALDAAASGMERAVEESEPNVRAFLERCRSARSFVYLGRGPGVVSANQSALMTKEMTSLHAEAMSAGQYRHGPIEVSGPDVPHILFAPHGKTHHLMCGLARDLCAYDTPVLLVTDHAPDDIPGATLMPVATVPEELSPLVQIVPIQRLNTYLALREGMTPGELRRIPKVVVNE